MMDLNPMLRPYQREQVESVVTNRKAGHNRLVVGSAVGTGKSVTIGGLCRLGRKPLVVAPNLNLLWQMHSGLAKYLGEDIDIEQGSRKVSNSGMHRTRVVLASRASLLSNDRYQKFGDRDENALRKSNLVITPRSAAKPAADCSGAMTGGTYRYAVFSVAPTAKPGNS